MSGRHQPEEGADSPGTNGDDPPMEELPRASRAMVEMFVRSNMPVTSTDVQVNHEVSMVMMADAMGRAIHVVRGPGQPLDIPRCVRVNKAGRIEEVPYAYDDERAENGYHCDCEQIALVLTNMIAAMESVDLVKSKPIIEQSN